MAKGARRTQGTIEARALLGTAVSLALLPGSAPFFTPGDATERQDGAQLRLRAIVDRSSARLVCPTRSTVAMPMFLDAALILSTLLLAPIMIPCVTKGPVAAFTESTPRPQPCRPALPGRV